MQRVLSALAAAITLTLGACGPGPMSTTTSEFRNSKLIIKIYEDRAPTVEIGDAQRAPTPIDVLNADASKGDVHAHRLLGHAYWQGSSSTINGINAFPRNRESAAWYYERAAQRGDAPSQYFLALALEQGDGVAKDEKSAFAWHQAAAQQGYVDAHAQLGYFLSTGDGGIPVDLLKAVEHMRFAASAGNAIAQLNMGSFYAKGTGVERSIAKAARWYWTAADQGNAEAMVRLARLLRSGEGIPRDDAAATQWLEQAAAEGHEQAQAMLGDDTASGSETNASDPWAGDGAPESGDQWADAPSDPWAEQDGGSSR
ncbi:MAG: tetratricopeptide repeat protein [Pseudomonadota bacterium]